jgi:3-hydroxyacyl-CoA dehydrogenase
MQTPRKVLYRPPPHLIPLVEIAGGKSTDPEVLNWAEAFYRDIGRHPIKLQREVYGHIANRLQYVLFNEAAKLVLEGVASPEDVDVAVSSGPGMRWALFGPFMTMHLGGGAGGLEAAFNKFRERDSTSTDRAARMAMSADQEKRFVEAAERLSAGKTVQQLTAMRDAQLIELLRLKTMKSD